MVTYKISKVFYDEKSGFFLTVDWFVLNCMYNCSWVGALGLEPRTAKV